LQHGVEPDAEGGIDDLLERFPEAGRALPGFGRHIGIERQGGSHAGIMMLHPALSMDTAACGPAIFCVFLRPI
jgi:hypothetical protein